MKSLRTAPSLLMLVAFALLGAGQQNTAPPADDLHTLTVVVENVNKDDGNIGVLVFNSTRGWPEDRFAALRDIVVPAQPGTVTITVRPALGRLRGSRSPRREQEPQAGQESLRCTQRAVGDVQQPARNH
jgi:hypothetical protein